MKVIGDVLSRDLGRKIEEIIQVDQAGRLHHKLCSEQHLFQIAVIPAGGEAFRLHPHPLALLVLQQAQGHAANHGEVGVGVPLPDATPVLAERHVELPMAAILDPPMPSDRRTEAPGGQLLAQDVVADLVTRLPASHRVADRHADPLQALPAGSVGQQGDCALIGNLRYLNHGTSSSPGNEPDQ